MHIILIIKISFPISNSYEEGNSGLMWGENVTYKITLTQKLIIK